MFGLFAKKPEVDYKSMWKTYSKWEKEDDQLYEKKMSTAKARLAAQGVAEGSEAWNRATGGIDQAAEKSRADLKSSQTYQTLQNRYSQYVGDTTRQNEIDQLENYIDPGFTDTHGESASGRKMGQVRGRSGLSSLTRFVPREQRIGADIHGNAISDEKLEQMASNDRSSTGNDQVGYYDEMNKSRKEYQANLKPPDIMGFDDWAKDKFGEADEPTPAKTEDISRQKALGAEKALGSRWMNSVGG